MDYIEIPGIGAIKVRRSANIKYLRLRMAPGRGLWVSVPYGVSENQVCKFISDNKEWIEKSRKKWYNINIKNCVTKGWNL